MNGMMEGAFLTRHSKKPKGEDKESVQYPGISESGVELAKERALEIKELIKQSEPGSVIFIGGGSNLIRTKSTAEVFGDELKALSSNEDGYIVVTRSEIEAMRNEEAKMIEKVVEIIKNNPGKKIVINFPMFLKELSMQRSGWFKEDGNPSDYLLELLERHNNDEYQAFREWIETKGEGVGPNPEQEGRNYASAIKRLGEFAGKIIPDRPIVVGLTGHSWGADVMVVSLANGGKVDLEAFDRITGGDIIKETELSKLSFKDGKDTISYRGNEYEIK